ncbi:SGNH/GDSL hydrolase family protein [Paenibacillus cisolokensis]|uniref:SGNH/GDSL hydrolase family protein n=1 Tax=Paenibacillus cisolokensis TaxID=1658519 RepID=UPI003D2CECE2
MSRYNSPRASEDDIEINLPRYIYGVVGHELNVYFDNIIDGGNLEDFRIDVVCSKGQQYADRYTLTPNSTGDTAITINVYRGHQNRLIAKATSIIRVAPEVDPNPKTIRALYIGDSNTASGTYVQELHSLFANDAGESTLELIGTLGTAPANHEGRGGWTADKYLTAASYNGSTNAFWDGSGFSFAYYMAQNAFPRPDFVIIQLGTNDAFSTPYGFTAADFVARLKVMQESIHAYDNTIKVCFSLPIPPARTQDPFGKMNSCDMTRAAHKTAVFNFAVEMCREFDGTLPNVLVVPINLNLDTLHNFPYETVLTSSRLARSYERISDQLHPTVEGRKQIADSHYAFLKNNQ